MTTIKSAGIGYPVKKSKSPLIYAHWAEKYGVDLTYDLFEWPPADLEKGIKRLVEDGYKGFSVTLPYKQALMRFCSDLDKTAQAVGAVNSVKISGGKLFASNTDAYGFIENLKAGAGPECLSGPAVVLGAGGAARAVVYGLLSEGVPEITLLNRTKEKAETLTRMDPARLRAGEWNKREESLANISLLVNTTSLGMEGQPPLEIGLDNLAADAVVNDIVYYPLETNLLKTAKSRNNKIVTGIGMLVRQAVPSFENWTGIKPAIDERLIKKVLS